MDNCNVKEGPGGLSFQVCAVVVKSGMASKSDTCLEDNRLTKTMSWCSPAWWQRLGLPAPFDPTLLGEAGVLSSLLTLERRQGSVKLVFGHGQPDLEPQMRALLAVWMLQVCEEEKCKEEVFLQCILYLDRYLSQFMVDRSHLQLLCAVFLFLASKLYDSVPLSSRKLCWYTDGAVTVPELLQWELKVASSLNWYLASVLPSDFLEFILYCLPNMPHHIQALRRHTHTFIALAATDYRFSAFLPSTIACASVAAAFRQLKILESPPSCDWLMDLLSCILANNVDSLSTCFEHLEIKIAACLPPCVTLEGPDHLEPPCPPCPSPL